MLLINCECTGTHCRLKTSIMGKEEQITEKVCVEKLSTPLLLPLDFRISFSEQDWVNRREFDFDFKRTQHTDIGDKYITIRGNGNVFGDL